MPDSEVRTQLDTLIRKSGLGYAEVSRLIGRNAAYVQQFIKRGVPRRLGEVERRLLASHFQVPEAMLGGPPLSAAALAPEPGAHRTIEVPCLGALAGASLTIDGALLAPAAVLASATTGRTPDLAACVVEGDAMAPTLLAGDRLLVDRADRAAPRDGFYLLESGPAAVVKRLSVNPVTRRVAILSDNAAYPSVPDCDPAELRLLGRVVWVGRLLA